MAKNEELYSKGLFEDTFGKSKIINRYYNRWLDSYLLYGEPKITYLHKIKYFIFIWKIRISNAWDALRGKNNW